MKNLSGKRVFVGLSGGVDSAVSAALLMRAGADVTGVFIKGWYPPGLPCTWSADRRDAMRVAARLRIPFVTLDAHAEYKQAVIDYLLAEYRAGRTPNPDIMCNRDVKFGAFYRYAKTMGADLIATGHYATGGYEAGGALLCGRDSAKDQSYFLWAVPKNVLADVVFPVGELAKSVVRTHATRLRLPVATKKDSQGICFLGAISTEDFLKKEFGVAEGKAIDEAGKEIGVHDGAVFATLGERVALTDAPSGPWFVLQKHIDSNVLVVGHTRLSSEPSRASIAFHEANWYEDPARAHEAQTRYHGPLVPGLISGNTFTPTNPLPEPAANGQSIVFYDGNRVIGGGIIGQ